MRTKRNAFKLVACLLVAVLFAALTHGTVPAKASTKTIEKTETIKADLTGDGKEDTIKLEFAGEEYGAYTKLNVYLNGKKSKTMKGLYYSYVEYEFFKLKSGKAYLYLGILGEDGSGDKVLLEYKSGKVKTAVDFDAKPMCGYINKLSLKGNKLTVEMGNSGIPGLGVASFNSTFTLGKAKIKETSKVHKLVAYGGGKPAALKVAFSFDIYSDKDCKKLKGTVPVGAKVKPTKLYISGKTKSIYVEGAGYKGWYRCYDYSDEPSKNEPEFCGTYFEGTWMAG